MKKWKKSRIITALTLCAVTAVSVMSIGLTSWQTTITGSGSVSAAGKWDVAVTDAGLQLSTGASASKEMTTYELERTGVKSDALITSVLSSSTWLEEGQEEKIGTQSEEALSKYTYYYLVDTTKYDMDNISALTKEDVAAIVSDESTVVISDYLKAYYRYIKPTTAYDSEKSTACAAKVVDGLLRDSYQLIADMVPDHYQDYMLVYLSSTGGKYSYSIASMVEKTETVGVDAEDAVTYTDTEVSFADVDFTLPGAWAQYSITVTNNGTVDANLSDAVIELETDSDQLVLDKPDLEKEVVKPGESCTITFVVKVPDTVTGDLDARGRLIITLPYGQISVEAAPAASHSHS